MGILSALIACKHYKALKIKIKPLKTTKLLKWFKASGRRINL
uniref:Uncharacterized protein n=1 Tax=Vibrio genomosp. F6 TaxID=723172 RepID=A0A0H3ZRI2_9VIBR|nr:hypothetical protein [Vibrio genomosp. F6]